MNMLFPKLISIICASLLLMGGCASVQQYATPENARVAATLVCSNTLAFAAGEGDRVEAAHYIYAVAHAVRTLAGGKVPTTEELRDTISLFTPNGGKWSVLGTAVGALWGGLYPKLNGNSVLAAKYLEAIAAGCEDAAAAYLPPHVPPHVP